MLSAIYLTCAFTMTGSLPHLPQSGRTFFSLVLSFGPRGFLQRYQHLSASMFPPSLWRHLDFYQLCKAEGRCPCNGINPVYLFLFITLKYEMFALYNHPPPDVAQRSSASAVPSVDPKRRCLPRRRNPPSRPRKQTWLNSRRDVPRPNLS